MSRFHNLHIDLKIAREDILVGLNKVFHAEEIDVETLVKDTFDKIDLEAMISKQIYAVIDRQVKDAVDTLIRYGEGRKLIDKSIAKIIDTQIASHLESVVNTAVNNAMGK